MSGSDSGKNTRSRLTFWQAAFVIARRDFSAVLFSRAFIFFLLGPLFPVIMLVLAGGIGAQVQSEAAKIEVGIAMKGTHVDAMIAAREELAGKLGSAIPEMVELERLKSGEDYDPSSVLASRTKGLAAIVTGTLDAPHLTATSERLVRWQGVTTLIAQKAKTNVINGAPTPYPDVTTTSVIASGASESIDRLGTAQSGQLLLFLLIMMLASMVLSNLVEEKGNKIIEILAAAIPMDALFLGKLFAMLGISIVGITVWGGTATLFLSLGGNPLAGLSEPGVGWPMFFVLGGLYFAMGYLLLGSIFLAVGSLATTVREVQTLALPATMAQVLVFFLASLAITQSGNWIEFLAMAFPLSSPFAMLARGAMDEALWPHAIALCWQALCVALFVKGGAALFRARVMKSGANKGSSERAKKPKRRLFSKAA